MVVCTALGMPFFQDCLTAVHNTLLNLLTERAVLDHTRDFLAYANHMNVLKHSYMGLLCYFRGRRLHKKDSKSPPGSHNGKGTIMYSVGTIMYSVVKSTKTVLIIRASTQYN